MEKNTGKVREFCQSRKVGTLYVTDHMRVKPRTTGWSTPRGFAKSLNFIGHLLAAVLYRNSWALMGKKKLPQATSILMILVLKNQFVSRIFFPVLPLEYRSTLLFIIHFLSQILWSLVIANSIGITDRIYQIFVPLALSHVLKGCQKYINLVSAF